MFLIGWGTKQKKDGDIGLEFCDHCRNTNFSQIVEVCSYLSLFFVPLFKRKIYKVICKTCSHSVAINEEVRQELLSQALLRSPNVVLVEIWNKIDNKFVEAFDGKFKKEEVSGWLEKISQELLKDFSKTDVEYVLESYQLAIIRVSNE